MALVVMAGEVGMARVVVMARVVLMAGVVMESGGDGEGGGDGESSGHGETTLMVRSPLADTMYLSSKSTTFTAALQEQWSLAKSSRETQGQRTEDRRTIMEDRRTRTEDRLTEDGGRASVTCAPPGHASG